MSPKTCFINEYFRLRRVAVELASKGHNVTFVSCDFDESQENLHFIHMEKVYESVMESDGFDSHFFEMGIKNIFLQYLDTPPLVLAVCDGLIRSNGWHQLNSYPNGFKVIFLYRKYDLPEFTISVRFVYSRFYDWRMSPIV